MADTHSCWHDRTAVDIREGGGSYYMKTVTAATTPLLLPFHCCETLESSGVILV